MKTIETIYGEAVSTEGKIFVWFTDKFLSGWGGGQSRHKQIVICEDWATAYRIYENLRYNRQHGALYVGIGKELPRFRNCSTSYRLAKDCPLWNK